MSQDVPAAGLGAIDAHPERDPSSAYWSGRRVLVTGGSGFLGSHVVDLLRSLGAGEVFVPRREDYDLTEHTGVRRVMEDSRPDVVLHLAAEVGGIGANRAHPGRFFYNNIMMGAQLIEEARLKGVDKFVQVGTVCAYPKYTPVPFREEDFWIGYPEETNAPYGIAKKALYVQLTAYRQEYGMNGIYLLPTNLYGPRDNFDPETSHVIPALIRRVVEARRTGADELVIWGTGQASREFLYVEDCARALVLAAEHYDAPEPVNVGAGREIRIAEVAALIAEIVGFHGRFVYDSTKPDGQPRRCLDTTKALALFGFRARMEVREGLERTIDWYLANGGE
ncbi:MAG TPA: GDP-L-fucose synthase [Longimicrobiaceae bacterium]|nr:GDP-L-fucose synthase [Longimicrobiaceae bacterium]